MGVESVGQPAQRARAHLREIRLVDVILVDVLEHALKDAQLRARIVRLLRAGEDPAADQRVESECGREDHQDKFGAKGH
jgi:hypothetical protein